MTEATNTQPDDFATLVSQYIKMRDAIKAAEDKHKVKVKPAKDFLESLNGKILAKLIEHGGDSIKTSAGTAYRTTRRAATISDGGVFRQFVVENEMFDIVDWRANANAVDDFIKSNGSTPPGVNFSTAYTVGVRRT